MVDLRVTGERVPSAHRPTEEVMALAVGTEAPEPRVIDALPALLAWNRWRPALLVAFAQAAHPRALTRLAWLADITLLIERTGGFPGGITGGEDLVNFLQRIERPHEDDHLGIPGAVQPEHRVWKYWRIDYPTDLQSFRDRALGLWTSVRGNLMRERILAFVADMNQWLQARVDSSVDVVLMSDAPDGLLPELLAFFGKPGYPKPTRGFRPRIGFPGIVPTRCG